MSHYDEQAKTAFKRGEYKKATGLLDRAIGRAPDIKLYDYRAACYEKLNDLPSALRDAKQGIKFAREDPTGYLRAGRILVKMGKGSQALEIYGYGLRHVQHRGALYEVYMAMSHILVSLLTCTNSSFARHTQSFSRS